MNCAHNKQNLKPIFMMPEIIIEADSVHTDSVHTESDSLHNQTMNLLGHKRIIADQSLPNAVYQNQKVKVIIKALFDRTVTTATGIMFAPGKIITVRHILKDFKNINPLLIEWEGTIITSNELISFPLNFIMAGKEETLEDILLLEIDTEFMVSIYEQTKNNPEHPYNIFTKKLTIVDSIFVNQTVYISIINSTSISLKPIPNWFPVNLPVEIIYYTFQRKILSVIDTPYIPDSLYIEVFRPLFRIQLRLSEGSSGSPIFNENGNLIGIIMATDERNFTFALSSKAIKEFLIRASFIK